MTNDRDVAKDDQRDADKHRRSDRADKAPSNAAPDAVKDPNEKTDGKPGIPGQGKETDPGAG